MARIRGKLSDGSHHSVAQRVAGAAFLIRVFSAALIYGTQILFARWMGDFEFGIYVYVWTWVLLVGDVADLGLASAAQRFVPEYTKRGAFDLLRGFLARSRWLALGSATIIAVLGAGAVQLLQPWLMSYLVLPLSLACVMLPFYVLMQVQDGIARSYNWIDLALLPIYIVRHAILLLLVVTAIVFEFSTNAVNVIALVGVSVFVTSLGQTILLNRRLRGSVEPGPKTSETRVWYATALPILMIEGFYLWLMHIDILLLQHFRTPQEVAVYFAAAKTLTLIAFVHFAVSAAVAHRFTEYHIAGDRKRLAELMAEAVRWTFWPSLAATLVVLAIGQPLLGLFGSRFTEGYHLMFILAIGLLARASIGPVERLLSMVGQQRVCAFVYACAFTVNLVLCLILIPRYGMDGAVVSTTCALLLEAAMLFWVTKSRLGLRPFILCRAKAP